MAKRSSEDVRVLIKGGNDKESFKRLFFENYKRLLSYASNTIKDVDDAKDLIQESFISFWQKRNTFTDFSSEGLLFIIVRNRCLNYLKQKSRIREIIARLKDSAHFEELYRIDYLKNEPLTLIAEDLKEYILETARMMPPTCFRVFELRCIEGFTNKEIADQLNCSVKNVEKHLKKARSILSSQVAHILE
jgi:RNA polymerase sigma-70 factor (ECF subfamily)